MDSHDKSNMQSGDARGIEYDITENDMERGGWFDDGTFNPRSFNNGIKSGVNILAKNLETIIAMFTVVVMISVFWFKISIGDILTVSFAADIFLTMLLFCIMQYEMHEKGKRNGKLDAQYISSYRKYCEYRDSAVSTGLPELDGFCEEYRESELKSARTRILSRVGIKYSEWYESYRGVPKKRISKCTIVRGGNERRLTAAERMAVIRANAMCEITLSPDMLICDTPMDMHRGGLGTHPVKKDHRRMTRATIMLVITSVFTASIVIEMAVEPTLSTFVYCLIKLFLLLWRGVSGYSSGYVLYAIDFARMHDNQSVLLGKYAAWLAERKPDIE